MKNKEREKASDVIITRNIYDLSRDTENIYESVAILSKRANQIAAEDKKELHQKIDEFASTMSDMDDMYENREQIEIVRRTERAPKPTLVATQEYLDDTIYFRNTGKESQEMMRLAEEEKRLLKDSDAAPEPEKKRKSSRKK